MIPVFQTREGLSGNCLAAVLASILEVPITVIPEFTDERFLDQLASFLLPLDLFYVQVSPNDPIVKAMFRRGDAYHTVEGISERGGLHACVGLNGEICHDPHVGGQGLATVECFGLLCDRSAIAGRPAVGRYA